MSYDYWDTSIRAGVNMYFIMVYSQNGNKVIPITDDNDEVAVFETHDEAEKFVKENAYAMNFGYEIFVM